MKLLNPLQQKGVADLKAGELVYRDIGRTPALALVLAEDEAAPCYGILQAARYLKPTATPYKDPTSCLSFGTAWALELVLVEPTAPSAYYLNSVSAGDLYVGGGEVILALETARGFSNGHDYFSFIQGKLVDDLPMEAARIAAWRIWASEEDWRRPGAKPVFEWPPPPPPPGPPRRAPASARAPVAGTRR